MDRERFRRALRNSLKKNRVSFEGRYKRELDALLGLSRTEIDRITPDSTDLETYAALITVVKEASARNLSQAALRDYILSMGDVAVAIAKKTPKLSKLF